jgi:hypothetical protein
MTAEEAGEEGGGHPAQCRPSPARVGEGIGSLADAQRFKEKAAVPVIVFSVTIISMVTR